MILILNHFKTGDFDFDFKSLFRCVILILISNHFTSDLSQHWLVATRMMFGCQEYFPQMSQVAYASIACAIIYVIAFAVGLGK